MGEACLVWICSWCVKQGNLVSVCNWLQAFDLAHPHRKIRLNKSSAPRSQKTYQMCYRANKIQSPILPSAGLHVLVTPTGLDRLTWTVWKPSLCISEMDWPFKVPPESSAHKKRDSTSPADLSALEECLKEPSQVHLQQKRFDLNGQSDRRGEKLAVSLHMRFVLIWFSCQWCWNTQKTQPGSETELLKFKLDLISDPFCCEMPGNPDPHPRYLDWAQKTFK